MLNELSPQHDQLSLSLIKSFWYRAQAIFYGRLCVNSLYLSLWLASFVSPHPLFSNKSIDLALIGFSFSYSYLCYRLKGHKNWGRWLHFLTLVFDLLIHIFFTQKAGYLLSPLMALHPLLSSAFLLLFHNPWLMLPPLMMLPLVTMMTFMTSTSIDVLLIFSSLLIIGSLNIVLIFFIHLTHSKEHRLLRSMVLLEKKLKDLAIVMERQRISRDFHDGVGAKMASIVMQCDYLLTKPFASAAKEELLFIKESAMESVDDMRRSIAFLNGDFDIAEQIEQIILKMALRHRTTIEQQGISSLKMLDLKDQVEVCRIIEEALNNALKHAKASRIWLNVDKGEHTMSISVQDDGIGFDQSVSKKHHYGLKNMADRAANLGGRFSFSSIIEQGSTISLEIPLN